MQQQQPQQQHDTPTPVPTPAAPTSDVLLGVITQIRASHGFIRCQLPTDVFFHRSAAPDGTFEALRAGDAVEFGLAEQGQAGAGGGRPQAHKRAAAWVRPTDRQPGLVVLEPQQLYGRVVLPPQRLPRPSAGVLRYLGPTPADVRTATFGAEDVVAGSAAPAAPPAPLTPQCPVAFRLLVDRRAQQLAHAGRTVSKHALQSYTRAAQVTPLDAGAVVSELVVLHACLLHAPGALGCSLLPDPRPAH